MELIEKEPTAQDVLPEPEPRYHTAALPVQKTEHGQSIVRILASILVGLILIVLIVLLARWIYHKAHHASETVNNPSTAQQTPAESSSGNAGTQRPGSGTPQTASPGNSAASSSAQGSSSSANAANNQQITNTGPGDVAAIFAGTALAAAGLHYIISIRRFSKQV